MIDAETRPMQRTNSISTRPSFASLPRCEGPDHGRRLRVCIASSDVVGPVRNGGIGTAYTALAETLTAAGHEVTILYVLGEQTDGEPVQVWTERYEANGIRFVPLPPS